MSRDLFCLGGVRLNFPEFTWSVSYSIAKLLLFYKNSSTIGAERENMAIICCIR